MNTEKLKTTTYTYIGSVDHHLLRVGKWENYFTLDVGYDVSQIKCILSKAQAPLFSKFLDWADHYIKVFTETKPEVGKDYPKEIIVKDFRPHCPNSKLDMG